MSGAGFLNGETPFAVNFLLPFHALDNEGMCVDGLGNKKQCLEARKGETKQFIYHEKLILCALRMFQLLSGQPSLMSRVKDKFYRCLPNKYFMTQFLKTPSQENMTF